MHLCVYFTEQYSKKIKFAVALRVPFLSKASKRKKACVEKFFWCPVCTANYYYSICSYFNVNYYIYTDDEDKLLSLVKDYTSCNPTMKDLLKYRTEEPVKVSTESNHSLHLLIQHQ